ncbi:MAG: TonB-dependent receptor plug domain-containing protein [Woeseiaceae bacterium]
MNRLSRVLTLAAVATVAMPVLALAQQRGIAEEEIEEVTVTGTRSRPRSVADSPVAIDSFGQEQLDMQPVGDMTENLKNLVPSFTATPLTGDASAFVRPVSLRGLPPDETLLLVNSKRRHRGAHLALFGAAMNFGAHPSDMGMLPSIGFKRVEVLRDGASSQYGSDAIAGVINFILRDEDEGGRVEAQYGQYYEGETSYKVAGWKGFRLGDSGFLNISGEWTDNEQLVRGFQPPGAQALIDDGTLTKDQVGADSPYGDGLAQTWGRPENDGVRTSWNMAVSFEGDSEFYSFGNYASTYGNYRFFWRNPSNNALQVVPRDPTDPDGDGIPGLPGEFEGNFSWGDELPAGFTPYFVGRQTDFSSVVGVRGEFNNSILYDFSGSFGTNKHEYTLFNSLSPTYGPESQRDFKTGDIRESDRSVNADFSYPLADNMNLGFGAEWREEAWTAQTGDSQSWIPGPWAGISNLINPDTGENYSEPAVGASGRSGFDGDASGTFRRTNWAAYGDLEWDISDAFLLQFALRWEDFSDFGTTTNGKVAARYSVSDRFTLRGAVSTGFRAPTPGQSNQRVVTTTFDVASGEQTVAGTIPPSDPALAPLGGRPLDPEEATNVSLGFSADLTDNLSLTFDIYQIDVDDRILKTSRISVAGVPGFEDAEFAIAEFYTNGADTETKGFDIVATYGMDHSGGSSTDFSLAFNHNETEISNLDIVDATGDPVISDQTLFNIENNLPENRASIAIVHQRDQWQITARSNWYDDAFDERDFPDGDLVKAAATVDIEARYNLNDNFTIVGGANNVFDEYPNKTDTRFSNGLEYSRRTPFGYDGGMWYLKGVLDF